MNFVLLDNMLLYTSEKLIILTVDMIGTFKEREKYLDINNTKLINYETCITRYLLDFEINVRVKSQN